jgi:hypothetical protein
MAAEDFTVAGRRSTDAGRAFMAVAGSDITAGTVGAILFAVEAGSTVSPRNAVAEDSTAERDSAVAENSTVAAGFTEGAAGKFRTFSLLQFSGWQLMLPAVFILRLVVPCN